MGHLHGPEAENEGGVSVNKDTLGNLLPAPERSHCRSKHKPAAAAAVARDTSLLLHFSLPDNNSKPVEKECRLRSNSSQNRIMILLVNFAILTLYHLLNFSSDILL